MHPGNPLLQANLDSIQFLDVEEDSSQDQMKQNMAYHLPVGSHHAIHDTKNYEIRPDTEDVKYATRVPDYRPMQLDIYNTGTTPPGIEVKEPSSEEFEDSNNQPGTDSIPCN